MEVTHVVVIVILFAMLLLIGIMILSGILPGFREALGNASCAIGVCQNVR